MSRIYTPLLTDFYQLTMASGYWQLGMHEQEAAFHLLFRKNPFKGNHAVTCGLSTVIDFIREWSFQQDDLDYLASLKDSKNLPLFTPAFLDYLANMQFSCDIDAIPEGTIVFPNTPVLRVQGSLIQCQLLETALLNILNFQSLIATKAARVCIAAEGDDVIEFGLRRAQGPDGALSASRAAYIGGCTATSNTLAGKLYDIPVRGTHAHSWVTAFSSEQEAFESYLKVMPHNSVLLVDTFNTIDGVANAIEAGIKLRAQGAELSAIRLDSGDMADLSVKARKMLDEAGFKNTGIMSSNSLDEYAIADLKKKGAKISAWGVGTNLVTAYDHPALDGVYKMSALKNANGKWDYKLKLSEQEVKISNPGRHQVRRFFTNDKYLADVIYDLDFGIPEAPEVSLFDKSMPPVRLDDYDAFVDLLQPLYSKGKLVQKQKSIHAIRKEAIKEVRQFHNANGTHVYPVGLEKKLHELKLKLMSKYRK
ncbi:MAG TPA: nicotinate phosphoribosyltransferase [Gammaproteobacteria bacterium]|jgi:nicotinate phosphoribosyltransferase|nr:nicotinate phosphoribosyltransferase [Gammaproteobacteria bacterium]